MSRVFAVLQMNPTFAVRMFYSETEVSHVFDIPGVAIDIVKTQPLDKILAI